MTEQQHIFITAGVATLALALLIPAAVAESGVLAWIGLLVGGVTIAFMIGCDPR